MHLKDHVETVWGPFILDDAISLIPERDLDTADAYHYIANRSGL
jgi:hypothetical protein